MSKKNIRVLHIDSEFGWRGGQQQVIYLLEQMQKRGYDTALIAQPESEINDYCLKKNLRCFPLRMKGEIDIIAGFRISRLVKKNQFNILHLHSAHALATGLWAKLFHKKVKLIGTRRVDFHIKNNPFSRLKYNNPMLNKIICISDQIKNVLLMDGVPQHRLLTIYSGVDIHKYNNTVPPPDFRAKIGFPENHLIAGTVAAMVDHKDYPNLLKAARIVINNNDNITFCAVGNGSEENKVLALAKELQLKDRFIFAGFRKDVGNFLKSFDIFVLSSHLEGLGTSILDAQGVGLPVVACKTGGIPEIIDNHINGLLVPLKNPEALAKAILHLAQNDSKRKKIGENSKKSVQKFSIEKTVQRYLELYDELLAPL